MSITLQQIRDNAANLASWTGKVGQLAWDITNSRLRASDGVTAGGIILPKMSDMGALLFGYAENIDSSTSGVDTAIPIYSPTINWRPTGIVLLGVSGSFGTATWGAFSAAGGGGTQLFNTAAYVTTSAPLTNGGCVAMTVSFSNFYATLSTIYLRTVVGQGSACRVNAYVLGQILP